LNKDGSVVGGRNFVLNALKWFGMSRLSASKVEVLEGSMEAKQVVITCTVTLNNEEIPTQALIDCRATRIAFMDQDIVYTHQVPFGKVNETQQVEVID